MKNRSVSLTGATGFVGWHIAEALRDSGWSARAVVRPRTTRPLPPGVARIEADLLHGSALERAVAGSDLVIHCAGVIRARDYASFADVNVNGTQAVVEAANGTGARLILISSLAAGGSGTAARPRREVDLPQPVNAYGQSKLAGEEVLRQLAVVPWTILRPSAVYGPRDRGFLPLFRMARRGLFLLAAPATTPFTLVDVRDLARATCLAADADSAVGQTLFVGHPQPHTTEDILRTLAGVFGREYRALRLPRASVHFAAAIGDLAWRSGRQFIIDSGRLAEFEAEGFVCSVDRAREALDFTASTSLGDGLAGAAAWYRDAGWL